MDSDEIISGRQATKLFLVAVAAPIIRIIPSFTAAIAKRASWVSALIALGFCVLIALFFGKMFNGKKTNMKSMDEALEKAFGKVITKVILVAVLVINLFILATRLRILAERMQTLLFVNTPTALPLIAFLTTVLLACKLKLKFIGRFMEMVELILIVSIAIVIGLALQNFNINNLYPVTFYDIPGAILGTYSFVGMMSLYSYVFYLGEHINQREGLLKEGIFAAFFVCAVGLGLILITVGTFGYRVTTALSQPFFIALKSSNVLGVFEGIESIFVTFWTIADFALVVYHTVISSVILKKILNLKSRYTMITPIVFASYMLAYAISQNFYVISEFTKYILIPIDILFALLIPIVAFIVIKFKSRGNITSE